MIRSCDNWERLFEAVIRREQLRQLCLDDSRSPSTRSLDSDFSFSSTSQDDRVSFRPTPSPLHPDSVKLKLTPSVKEGEQSGSGRKPAKRRNATWKGLWIFSVFSSKKAYGKHERELLWAEAQRTLHGLVPPATTGILSNQSYAELSLISEAARTRAEIARFRELQSLRGHIESVIKQKGLDIDSIPKYYTV